MSVTQTARRAPGGGGCPGGSCPGGPSGWKCSTPGGLTPGPREAVLPALRARLSRPFSPARPRLQEGRTRARCCSRSCRGFQNRSASRFSTRLTCVGFCGSSSLSASMRPLACSTSRCTSSTTTSSSAGELVFSPGREPAERRGRVRPPRPCQRMFSLVAWLSASSRGPNCHRSHEGRLHAGSGSLRPHCVLAPVRPL